MKIYITRGDQKAGPYNLAQINAFLNIGRLNLEDLAWFEGCQGWIKVRGVPGVKILNPADKLSPPERPVAYSPNHPPESIPAATVRVPVSTHHAAVSVPAVTPIYDRQPSRSTNQYIYRTRIHCRICDAGELMKTRLYRFSFSIQFLGTILLFLSEVAIAGLLLAYLPIDISGAGSFVASLKKTIIENTQFLIITSLAGVILYFLFHSKKHVLRCDHCESIVAIEKPQKVCEKRK